MDPLRYYNFKNSLELQETLGGTHYNFRAVFNGGFVSGIYSYHFNTIMGPIFGQQLTAEEKREITEVLKAEVERSDEREEKREEKELMEQEEKSLREREERRLRKLKDLE